MLRRQSVTVIRLSSSHLTRPRHYVRHQPLSVRPAVRPTTRSSHHPTNLPQIFPRSSSPSRRNSTVSNSKAGFPSKRMRFVRRFVETAALSSVVFGTYFYVQARQASSSSDSPAMPRKSIEIPDFTNPYATRKKVLQLLTPEECTTKLRTNEESYLVSRGNGVYRYDVNQLASNDPIEDDRIEQIIAAPSPSGQTAVDVTADITNLKTGFPMVKNASSEFGDWMFWGIFDGHVGWYTSDLLKRQLVPYVVRELSNLYSQNKIQGTEQLSLQSTPSSLAIDEAIKRGFTSLDDEIVLKSVERLLKNPSKRLAADTLLPAHSGSCALLTFFDSQTGRLKVACTGDSRAILGRKDQTTGKWVVEVLTVDQTGRNVDEANRLRKEHPGEERDVVKRGRVLGGLEPTRAFGDARYKLPIAIQDKLQEYWGRQHPSNYKTPPYVTAEPVVTTTTLTPADLDESFIVMGTDGLWEKLTNEEVVGLVGKWIDKKKGTEKPGWFGKSSDKLNVAEVQEPEGAKKPGKRANTWVWQDGNAATHLIRNALGGGNLDELCGIMSLPAPLSRYYRDDITVSVVFLGDVKMNGTKDGGIFVNEEATGGGVKAVKSKL